MSSETGKIPDPVYLHQIMKAGMTPEVKKAITRRAASLRKKQKEEAQGQRRYELFSAGQSSNLSVLERISHRTSSLVLRPAKDHSESL